jgi:DNA-directed RNA polymerase beta subunit
VCRVAASQVCRPLLVVEHGVPRLTNMHMRQLAAGLLTLSELIRDGVIEYVDVNEVSPHRVSGGMLLPSMSLTIVDWDPMRLQENNCYIALAQKDLTFEHTHLEIDPLTILGVVAGASLIKASWRLVIVADPRLPPQV